MIIIYSDIDKTKNTTITQTIVQLVGCILEQVVLVWALAGVTVLCCLARYFTLKVPLSIQEYKWVPAKKLWEVTCNGLVSPTHFMLQKPG